MGESKHDLLSLDIAELWFSNVTELERYLYWENATIRIKETMATLFVYLDVLLIKKSRFFIDCAAADMFNIHIRKVRLLDLYLICTLLLVLEASRGTFLHRN
jgi:hypothetical protein